jgi:hypothetical protein
MLLFVRRVLPQDFFHQEVLWLFYDAYEMLDQQFLSIDQVAMISAQSDYAQPQ